MSEEEIKQLAADAIPVYPIYADLLDGIRWQTYIDHLRMEWVKGYKAALSTPAQPVPVKPEGDILDDINSAYKDNWKAKDEVDTDAEGHLHHYEGMDYEPKFNYEQFGKDIEEIYLTYCAESHSLKIKPVQDEKVMTIDDMNRSPEYKALERLVFLKHYKDNHGKNDYYLREQPKAWKVAKGIVDDCALDYGFKLLQSSSLPPAPVKAVEDEIVVPEYIRTMHEKYGYTTTFETPIHPTHKKWLPAAWEIEKIYGFVEAGELSLGKARELTTAVIEELSIKQNVKPVEGEAKINPK